MLQEWQRDISSKKSKFFDPELRKTKVCSAAMFQVLYQIYCLLAFHTEQEGAGRLANQSQGYVEIKLPLRETADIIPFLEIEKHLLELSQFLSLKDIPVLAKASKRQLRNPAYANRVRGYMKFSSSKADFFSSVYSWVSNRSVKSKDPVLSEEECEQLYSMVETSADQMQAQNNFSRKFSLQLNTGQLSLVIQDPEQGRQLVGTVKITEANYCKEKSSKKNSTSITL